MNKSPQTRNTLSVMVENRYGELARIVGLFGGRGCNIESLTVAETLDPAVSCVTVVISSDDAVVQQIAKQLKKLVRVLDVRHVNAWSHLQREMVLLHIKAEGGPEMHRALSLVSLHQLKVVEVTENSLIVEATGGSAQISEVITALTDLGEVEIVRTGVVALPRKPEAMPHSNLAPHADKRVDWESLASANKNRHPIQD